MDCYATDISKQALAIAADNANSLKLKNIEFFHGHWCQALPKIEFDAIVSNPPYISSDDPAIEEQVKKYEPKDALIAAENGLKAIKIIATDARSYLKKNGRLILEHGYQQKAAIYQLLTTLNFHDIKCYQDLAAKDRLTIAKF